VYRMRLSYLRYFGSDKECSTFFELRQGFGHARGYLFRLRLTNKLTRLITTRCFVALGKGDSHRSFFESRLRHKIKT